MHPTITMLLQRMEQHPEEFVNIEWDPVAASGHNLFHPTRWERISDLMSETDPFSIGHPFTEEERTVYNACIKGLVRDRVVESITKELLTGDRLKEMEYKNKQLNLYGGASPKPININPTSILAPSNMVKQATELMQKHIDQQYGLPKDIFK